MRSFSNRMICVLKMSTIMFVLCGVTNGVAVKNRTVELIHYENEYLDIEKAAGTLEQYAQGKTELVDAVEAYEILEETIVRQTMTLRDWTYKSNILKERSDEVLKSTTRAQKLKDDLQRLHKDLSIELAELRTANKILSADCGDLMKSIACEKEFLSDLLQDKR